MKSLTGVTFQVRVKNYNEGSKWYEHLFNRKPDFIPHEGFAEWEIVNGAWHVHIFFVCSANKNNLIQI